MGKKKAKIGLTDQLLRLEKADQDEANCQLHEGFKHYTKQLDEAIGRVSERSEANNSAEGKDYELIEVIDPVLTAEPNLSMNWSCVGVEINITSQRLAAIVTDGVAFIPQLRALAVRMGVLGMDHRAWAVVSTTELVRSYARSEAFNNAAALDSTHSSVEQAMHVLIGLRNWLDYGIIEWLDSLERDSDEAPVREKGFEEG